MDRRWPPNRDGFSTINSRPPSTATPQRYRDTLNNITRSGNYVAVPRSLAGALGLDAAAIVMTLISVGQVRAGQDGFLKVTPSFLCRGLGIDPDREQEAITHLLNRAIIEVRDRGSLRHIRLDLDKLHQIMKDERNDD